MPSNKLSPYHPFRSPEARERYLAHYDERAKSYPVPSETRVVSTSEGSTLVRVSGPEDGPPVMLLNGKWSDSLMWPDVLIRGLSARQRMMSGSIPISRSLPTECWVGFVFSSSAALMKGTSVTWI